MYAMLVVTGAVLFPVGCLVFVLFLDHIEGTLDASLKKTGSRPAPASVRAVPATHATSAAARPVQARSVPTPAESSSLSAAS